MSVDFDEQPEAQLPSLSVQLSPRNVPKLSVEEKISQSAGIPISVINKTAIGFTLLIGLISLFFIWHSLPSFRPDGGGEIILNGGTPHALKE